MIIILRPEITPHSPEYRLLMDYLTNKPGIQTRLHQETDPAQAAAGTIRQRFGTAIQRNAIHGSDAPETAAFELRYFFSTLDLL